VSARRNSLGAALALLLVLCCASSALAAAPSIRVVGPPTPDRPSTGGKTTIAWSSGGRPGRLTVQREDGGEQLVAQGPGGTAAAPWLLFGHRYVLRVYARATGGRPVLTRTTGFVGAHPEDILPPGTRPAATSKVINIFLLLVPFLGGLWLLWLAADHLRHGRRDLA
jgi:hypothetical protein